MSVRRMRTFRTTPSRCLLHAERATVEEQLATRVVQDDDHHHGTLATFVLGLTAVFASTLGLIVLFANLASMLIPMPLLHSLWAQPIWVGFEVAAAVFLADAASGAAHFLLDHMDSGEALRDLKPSTLAGVHEVLDSPAFQASSGWQRFVWEQHQHHPFPFPRLSAERQPTSLSVRRPGEHGGQLVVDMAVFAISALTAGTYVALGAWPVVAWVVRVMLDAYLLTWAALRWTHFWSHERNWSPDTLPAVVWWAQDAGLLLHPNVHRLHHQTYDGHFCLLNGWAGQYTQVWYRAFRAMGIL